MKSFLDNLAVLDAIVAVFLLCWVDFKVKQESVFQRIGWFSTIRAVSFGSLSFDPLYELVAPFRNKSSKHLLESLPFRYAPVSSKQDM